MTSTLTTHLLVLVIRSISDIILRTCGPVIMVEALGLGIMMKVPELYGGDLWVSYKGMDL